MACCITLGSNLILLVNIYIPPYTTRTAIKQAWDDIENYITELESRCPKAKLLLSGDFNARLGANNGSLFSSKLWGTVENEIFMPPYDRASKDLKVNYGGICLSQMMSRLGLVVINGTLPHGCHADFTFISGQGSSVVDYILISQCLSTWVTDFSLNYRLDSDHLPLVATFSLKSPVHITPNFNLQNNSITFKCNRIFWNERNNSKLQAFLTSPEGEELKNSVILATDETSAINNYSTLINTMTAGLTTKKSTTETRQRVSGPKWFDKECYLLKAKLRETYNQYRTKNLTALPQSYYELKKKYKQLISLKKKQALHKRWNILIEASVNKESKLFWSLVTGALASPVTTLHSNIPPETWELHFANIFVGSAEVSPSKTVDIDLQKVPEWEPVTQSEIKDLIHTIKPKKAPGIDMVLPEILKANISFWSPLLASLFTYINNSGKFPHDWSEAIVIPIFKKGNRDDPTNYRPISLLSVVGKLYSSYLNQRLTTWVNENDILGIEQAGFRKGRATIDHCITLSHLAEKYMAPHANGLFTAFIDLKSAFDSIPRNRLWQKLLQTSIDKRLLHLIMCLHQDTTLRVRCGTEGNLTKPIPATLGVRQGCILAPTLFNLYLNDLIDSCHGSGFHLPSLKDTKCPLLLYADDAVLLSVSEIGLKRLMRSFMSYCRINLLTINISKTKIMIFRKHYTHKKWKINGQPFEQVREYKYLGILFKYNLSWTAHRKSALQTAQNVSKAIIRYFFTKGAQFIPAAIRVFQAKVIPQLLYGCPVWITGFHMSIESVLSSFLRSLLGLPKCAPAAALRLETGVMSLEGSAWLHAFRYWLKTSYAEPSAGHLYAILNDVYTSSWSNVFLNKLHQLGFSREFVYMFEHRSIKTIIEKQIKLLDHHYSMTNARKSCSPLQIDPNFGNVLYTNYLENLTIPKYRLIFTKARFNCFPSAVVEGRYKGIPYENRLCPCNNGEIETLEHVLLVCGFYKDERTRLFHLTNISDSLKRNPEICVKFLLGDKIKYITEQVAKFLIAAQNKRKNLTS